MSNLQIHLDRIRSDAAECIMLSQLAGEEKKVLFATMGEHLNRLASEIETSISLPGTAQDTVEVSAAPSRELALASSLPAQPPGAARRRRLHPWLFVVVGGVLAGVLLGLTKPWEKSPYLLELFSENKVFSFILARSKRAEGVELSNQSPERKAVAEQVSKLAARVDILERAVDKLAKPELSNPRAGNASR